MTISNPNTICGFDRDALETRLCILALIDDGEIDADSDESMDQLRCAHTPEEEHAAIIAARERCNAIDAALHEPAKLAELLAEALQERGVKVLRIFPESAFRWHNPGFGLLIACGSDSMNPQFSCAKACAALLRILELPEGATDDDAVKALQENPS